MNNPDYITIYGITGNGNLKPISLTEDGVMQVNSPPGAPGGATETTLDAIKTFLQGLLSQQIAANSLSVVLASDAPIPITASAPIEATLLNQDPLLLVTPGTVYTVTFTDALSLEFSSRGETDIRWHYTLGQVQTNNYFTLNAGSSRGLEFGQSNRKFTGTLYFLSPTEENVEIEFTGFS